MYTLTLTRKELDTIRFVGGRYCWSEILCQKTYYPEDDDQEEISFTFPEHEAWEIRDECEIDTMGGHAMFPMLASDSALYEKLHTFVWEIV